MWMSTSTSTSLLLPIALSMAPQDRNDKFGAALVLAVAWGASVGGLGTPVGTPPNGFGITELRQRGVDLGFVERMAIGVQRGLVLMGGLIGVLLALYGGWRA